ncbi:hypothetical protein AVEN_209027-1 [Araneus ventricosus]|uniref:Uncharacterized protein n=1 Tax=Araneus ventricosus TaxID=182803 RepID=A0A4Y2J628_ARAVE|nr:hypothetical protein AVEN_209027-1 [Araneus ventricosus]
MLASRLKQREDYIETDLDILDRGQRTRMTPEPVSQSSNFLATPSTIEVSFKVHKKNSSTSFFIKITSLSLYIKKYPAIPNSEAFPFIVYRVPLAVNLSCHWLQMFLLRHFL